MEELYGGMQGEQGKICSAAGAESRGRGASEDMESVQRFVQEEMCSSRHANGILTKKLCFRRCADDAYQWMKLTMHIFRERYTDRVYALLYLKNIDSGEKKRAGASESGKSGSVDRGL